MYQVGDLIIYGNTGVCRVAQITTPKFDKNPGCVDGEKLYYVLEPLYKSETIYTPVDNDKVLKRKIISEQEALRLIDTIPHLQAKAYHASNMQGLKEYYQNLSQTQDCADLIELVMSIYAKKQDALLQNKRLGQIDEQFMKRVTDNLHGEFAAALGIEKDDVPAFIAQRAELTAIETPAE